MCDRANIAIKQNHIQLLVVLHKVNPAYSNQINPG